ncbi:MAG TPA: nucleotidyltransferase [Alphaproteobacteria bacterium]|nr:nucleotidyltransferase [Alphaproteobacteria bacterium]
MTNITDYFVLPKTSVEDVIKKMSNLDQNVVFIVDNKNHLLGVFSNEEMRDLILLDKKHSLPIDVFMNKNPVVLRQGNENEFQEIIKKTKHFYYPIVNADNVIVDVFLKKDIKKMFADRLFSKLPSDVHTAIMAGGLGTRLYPYTKVLPKALVPINDIPILTRIINNFKKFGCQHFDLILNHKKEMIKAYYAEEKSFDLNFYEEKEFLGTAGGLCLLKDVIKKTFFVSNCDVLINADYAKIYEFHIKEKNLITIVGASKNVQISYGVIHVKKEGSAISAIEEKPTFPILTNTGMYVLEPEALLMLKDNQFMHMTDLIEQCLKEKKKVGVFPILDKDWLDMGQLEEMEQMIKALERKADE